MAGEIVNKKSILIEAQARSQTGKGYAHKLRRAGKIPACLAADGKSVPIELDPKLLSKAWKENERKFELTLNGTTKTVRITELQVHPVKRVAVHVDLAYV